MESYTDLYFNLQFVYFFRNELLYIVLMIKSMFYQPPD